MTLSNPWSPVFNGKDSILYSIVNYSDISTQYFILTLTNSSGNSLVFETTSSLSFWFRPLNTDNIIIIQPDLLLCSPQWTIDVSSSPPWIKLTPKTSFALVDTQSITFKVSNFEVIGTGSGLSSITTKYAGITGILDGSIETPVTVVFDSYSSHDKPLKDTGVSLALDNQGEPDVIYIGDASQNHLTLTISNTSTSSTPQIWIFTPASTVTLYFTHLIDNTDLNKLAFTNKDAQSRWQPPKYTPNNDGIVLTPASSFSITSNQSIVLGIEGAIGSSSGQSDAIVAQFNQVNPQLDGISLTSPTISLEHSGSQSFSMGFQLSPVYPYKIPSQEQASVYVGTDKFEVANVIVLTMTGNGPLSVDPSSATITITFTTKGSEALTTSDLMSKVRYGSRPTSSDWTIMHRKEDDVGVFTIKPNISVVFEQGNQIIDFEFTNVNIDSSILTGQTLVKIEWSGFLPNYDDGSTSCLLYKSIPAPGINYFQSDQKFSVRGPEDSANLLWNTYGTDQTTNDDKWQILDCNNSLIFENLPWSSDGTQLLSISSHPQNSDPSQVTCRLVYKNDGECFQKLILRKIGYISFGQSFSALAITPDSKTLYVADLGANSVSVIDTATNTNLNQDILIGQYPRPCALAITPDSKTLYVCNNNSNSVSVIDIATNKNLYTDITVGKNPTALAITPDGQTLYVANQGSNSVSVIATATNTNLSIDIHVGQYPRALAITPDGKTLYVANQGSNSVSVIATATNTNFHTDITVQQAPGALAITPDGQTLYVANVQSNVVSAIDLHGTSPIVNIPVGQAPNTLAITPDGQTLYVSNFNGIFSSSMSIINLATNTNLNLDFLIGQMTNALAITPNGNTLYGSNGSNGINSVIVIPLLADNP